MQYIVVGHSENCMLLSKGSQTQSQSPKSQETFWSSKDWGQGLVHLCWGSFMAKVPARSFAKINIFTKSQEQLTIPPAHNYNFPIRKLPWKTHFGSIGMCFLNKAKTFWFQPIFYFVLQSFIIVRQRVFNKTKMAKSHTGVKCAALKATAHLIWAEILLSFGGGIQKKTVVLAKLLP